MKTWKQMCMVCVVMLCVEQADAAHESPAKPDPAPPWGSLFWKYQTTAASKHVGYVGYRLSTDLVIYNELSVVAPSGLKVGIWWSTGTDDAVFSSNSADEIQWTLGWTRTFSGTTYVAEVVYMDFMPLDRIEKDVIAPRLRFGHAFDMGVAGKLATSLQIEDRVSIPSRARRPTVTLAVNDTVRMTQRWSVGAGVSALYDHGSPTADSGVLLRWGGEVLVAMTQRITGSAFIRRFDPLTIEDKRTAQTVFGVSFAITF